MVRTAECAIGWLKTMTNLATQYCDVQVKCSERSRHLYQCNIQTGTYSNICPTRCNVTQFILSGNCSTCFGWYNHPSSGAQTTVSTASVICHAVTATCRNSGTTTHHQERKQLYLQHLLFVTPLLLPAAIVAGSSNGMTTNRCCRYSCLRS